MEIFTGLRSPLAISLGAISGALVRYYLTLWFSQRFIGFPWGTGVINLSGCFLIGIVTAIAPGRWSPEVRLMVTTGFLGAYTTFSTYELETVMLMRNKGMEALLYGLGSAVLGVVCVLLGMRLGELMGGARPGG
ncbi:MAG: fluoride efflux transporter CrcB [Alkalinema sp. RU_4_3]|nr:fluoride efflux transporter CrcB [Alkalinema sp. RU_4_3]